MDLRFRQMRARQHSNTAEFRAQERDAKRQKKAEAEARLDAGEDPLTTDTEVDSDYAPSEVQTSESQAGRFDTLDRVRKRVGRISLLRLEIAKHSVSSSALRV